MKLAKLDLYRQQLEQMTDRLRVDVSAVEAQTLVAAGGQANGELSNAPMHMADSGTDAFLQEMSSVLLENEQFLLDEAVAALQRFNDGTFGVCEDCRQPIPAERLDAIPYARRCVTCAAQSDEGQVPNLNVGRPGNETENFAAANKLIDSRETSLERGFSEDSKSDQRRSSPDSHAAGTPGGGTELGGLAGTNVGRGNPEGVELEDAMANGLNDRESEEDDEAPKSNRSGRAVRGTSARKRPR